MKKNIYVLLSLIGLFGFIYFMSHESAGARQTKKESAAVSEVMLAKDPLALETSRQPELSASAFISASINHDGHMRILAEKHPDRRLRIASITKLMTAIVALKQYGEREKIAIPDSVVGKKGSAGKLKTRETFFFKDLLRLMLIESDNDAARTIAAQAGEENFVELMNREAADLGLRGTHFINPTGLDPDGDAEGNYSTASDLIKLMMVVVKNYPSILAITRFAHYDLYTADGLFHHTAQSTNKLLGRETALNIRGGKTGETPKAKKNLIIVTEAPAPAIGSMIHVVLNSDDNFEDMEKLLEWARIGFSN